MNLNMPTTSELNLFKTMANRKKTNLQKPISNSIFTRRRTNNDENIGSDTGHHSSNYTPYNTPRRANADHFGRSFTQKEAVREQPTRTSSPPSLAPRVQRRVYENENDEEGEEEEDSYRRDRYSYHDDQRSQRTDAHRAKVERHQQREKESYLAELGRMRPNHTYTREDPLRNIEFAYNVSKQEDSANTNIDVMKTIFNVAVGIIVGINNKT